MKQYPALLPSLLILISIEIISFQLLIDPYAQERFTRAIRENARILNPLLDHLQRLNMVREIISVIGIVSGPLFLLGVKFFSQLLILGITLYGLINFSPLMMYDAPIASTAVLGAICCYGVSMAIHKLIQ